MGAEPWSYFVPFQANVETALQSLRQQVFESGEFRGSELSPSTPEEAFENMDADGTASILDITAVSDEPDFCCITRLPDDQLLDLFGTTQPTREQIESNDDFFEEIERGQGIYFVVYRNAQPSEYFIAGYSFD